MARGQRGVRTWRALAAIAAAAQTALSSCSPASPGLLNTDGAAAVPSMGDVCKTSPPGPASVELGQGQNAFGPLVDGQTVQVERGPQGGYHVWLAVQVKNVQRQGTRTSISAVSSVGSTALPGYDVVFTFDPGEGGFCELYGLRYRVDTGGIDVQALLGSSLDITVRVTDASGASAEDHKRVTLSSDVI